MHCCSLFLHCTHPSRTSYFKKASLTTLLHRLLDSQGYDDFIFVNRFGQVQHQGTLNKAIKRNMRDCNDEVIEKEGIENDPVLLPNFSCHTLRHTFATRLCESGINVKVIQDVLGHADISTTMDIYVDVMDELKKREIASFDSYMAKSRETI